MNCKQHKNCKTCMIKLRASLKTIGLFLLQLSLSALCFSLAYAVVDSIVTFA